MKLLKQTLKKILVLSAIYVAIFEGSAANSAPDKSTWLGDAIIKKVVAADELTHAVSDKVTDIKSSVTFQNRTKQYGNTIYRVSLDYKLTWNNGDGFSVQHHDYLALLQSFGQLVVFKDDFYFLKELAHQKFASFEDRKNFVLNSYSDGMMNPVYRQYLENAQDAAEKYISAKDIGISDVVESQTLVVGLGSVVASAGKSVFYRFEIVSQNKVSADVKQMQYIMVIVDRSNGDLQIFQEGLK